MFQKFLQSFHQSETIWWARIKLTAGALLLAAVSSGADFSVFLNEKEMFVWQIFSTWLVADGGLSEFVRRYKADFTATVNDEAPK